MTSDNYLLEFEDFRHRPIKHLIETLEITTGKNLSELKVRDLTYHNSQPIWPAEGVYLFRENKDVILVGKVSSQSFTERIAKHFDIRHFAWFNRLLELICIKILKVEWNDDNAVKASEYAFEKLNIVLINFTDRDRINRTERLFRACMQPLNKFKTIKEKDLDQILDKY
jgi:hypothetical protein